MAKLVLFDIDDTICDRDSTEVYPQALDFFASTSADIAFVTNQGGPACHDAGWSFSKKFPSLEQVEDRLSAILTSIPLSARILLYVCYAYKRKNGVVIVPKSDKSIFSACTKEICRKPNPGMLRWAMGDYDVKPHECLMVSDRDEDRLTAEAAEVAFLWAHEFFGSAK